MPHTPLSPPTSPATATQDGNAATASTPRGGGASTGAGGGGLNSALNRAGETLSNTFPCSESAFANALQLPPRNVTNVRVKKLARGTDWEIVDGAVMLTEKSLPLLAAALNVALTSTELMTLVEKTRAVPTLFNARVARFPINRLLLTVTWIEGGLERRADILVNKRDNFRLGMEVPIRLNSATQRYELARRAPRMKGRW